jgi:hypothetical protein
MSAPGKDLLPSATLPALPARPWRALPRELVAVIGPELEALGAETIEAIRAEIPEYARPLEGRFGRALGRGVQQALDRFVAIVGDDGPEADVLPPIYRQLGAGEWRDGRSLDALQAAYRLGARIAWRRIGAAAAASGADPDTQRLLAESIFAYIDELAGESVAGYAAAQAAAAGARETRRRALVELLLSEPSPAPDDLAAAAREAGWIVPRQVAVIVLATPHDGTLAGAIDPDALAAGEVIVLPDPEGPGRRDTLERVLGQQAAAVGPAVAPGEATLSLRWARATLELQAGADHGLTFAGERLVELALAAGAEPLAALRAARLAELDALPAGRRDRLAVTLEAWLDHQGSAPAAAADLHLHPQTVRYRLAQLRDLLGEQLDDPRARLELTLALRSPAQ